MCSNSSEDLKSLNQVGKNGPVVHIRADSDSAMEELFAAVTKQRANIPLQVPLRMRNLPASFFSEPTSGSKSPSCHSRENSVDNTLDPRSPGMQSVGSPQPPAVTQPPQPYHSRTHSSPATLQQNLSVVQQPQSNNLLHLRQQSYDVTVPGDHLGPLPHGWDMAKAPDGQVYFMNHSTKTTQWQDPRTQMQPQQQQQLQPQQPPQQPQPPQPPQQPVIMRQMNGGTNAAQPPTHAASTHARQQINMPHQRSNSFDSLGPLPPGWEQSTTSEGDIYFINHREKSTTWQDPRINNGLTPDQTRQQSLRLQRLQNENRALKERQRDLTMKEQRLVIRQRSQSQENIMQAQEMLSRQTLGDTNPVINNVDPFLSNANENHTRDGSGDSGVAMGSNFNLGSIPEDGPVDMDSAMTDLEVLPNEIMQDVLGSSDRGGMTWL